MKSMSHNNSTSMTFVLTESKRKEMQVELDTFQTSKQNNSRKNKRKKVVIKKEITGEKNAKYKS